MFLFNDALNTFYLGLYGVGHMVKDHSDSERENPLPPHGLLFTINSNGFYICTIHRRDSTYHGLCTPVVEHWLERDIAQWVHHMKDRSDDPSHHERTLLPRSYISPRGRGISGSAQHIGPLETRSGLEPLTIYKPNTYRPFVRRKVGNVLFNDAANTFNFYGYMASYIW